jgi:hypothetical protein
MHAPEGSYIDINVDNRVACAIKKADGSIVCWGYDEYGGLDGADMFLPTEL